MGFIIHPYHHCSIKLLFFYFYLRHKGTGWWVLAGKPRENLVEWVFYSDILMPLLNIHIFVFIL